MTKTPWPLMLLLSAILGGCEPTTPPGVDRMPPEPSPDACGASGMQNLVGKDQSIFVAMTLPMGTRIIEPGMPVTEDYSAERLNFDIGKNGRITRVWCG